MDHDADRIYQWLEDNLDVRQVLKTEIVCVCPFHQTSKTTKPDFYVNPDKGVYHCLSTQCNARGTITRLVMRLTGQTVHEARRELGRPTADSMYRMLNQLNMEVLDQPSTTVEEVARYKVMGHRFWRERDINAETIFRFDLGYDWSRQAGVIPHFNYDGDPHALIRRFEIPENGMKYHHPAGFLKEQHLFNAPRMLPQRPTLVVEGPIDCLRIQQHIWELELTMNVVAIFGSKVSNEQLRQLRHLDITLMFDPDPAGVKGQLDFAARFPRIVKHVLWGNVGQDPGNLSAQEFIHLIRNRTTSKVQLLK